MAFTNACFDLWAKSRGVPLWRLLLDLSPKELVRTLDDGLGDEIEGLTPMDVLQLDGDQRLGLVDYDVAAGGQPDLRAQRALELGEDTAAALGALRRELIEAARKDLAASV